jgi:hypothetical protein
MTPDADKLFEERKARYMKRGIVINENAPLLDTTEEEHWEMDQEEALLISVNVYLLL